MFPLYFLYDVWAISILRIVLGAIFIAHGWPKIKDLKQNAKNFEGMGFRPAGIFGTTAAILEFVGGILILIGFGTTWVALLFILEFIVIILWKWGKKIAFVSQSGWEFDLLVFAGVIVLFSLGAGRLSLDHVIFGYV